MNTKNNENEIEDLLDGSNIQKLAYPFSTTTNIKTINGLAYASVKNVNGLA